MKNWTMIGSRLAQQRFKKKFQPTIDSFLSKQLVGYTSMNIHEKIEMLQSSIDFLKGYQQRCLLNDRINLVTFQWVIKKIIACCCCVGWRMCRMHDWFMTCHGKVHYLPIGS
jgi:hypothetical protein